MKPKISVIIPFFYSSKKTIGNEKYFSLLAFDKCLSGIFKSKFKNFEVIAVSDGSSIESIEIAKRYPCKLIKLKKNSGSGHSRNVGAKKAKGKILVFIDSDVEVKSNAFQIINDKFKKKSNYALQGVFSHEPKYKLYTTEYLQSYHCYHLFSATQKKAYTQTLCTSIFSIKKDLFFKLNGFDSNFNSANAEDSEFGFRLLKEGFKILLEKKINVIHHTNFGLWTFIKRILKIHTGEMKVYLRSKTISMKMKQSNYSSVFLGIALIFSMLVIAGIDYLFKISHFISILSFLNILFILIHFNFLKFIYISKGVFSSFRAIIFSDLHRFLFLVCIFFGIIDFYIFRNKY